MEDGELQVFDVDATLDQLVEVALRDERVDHPQPALVLRIGAFQPREAAERAEGIAMADAWVSRRDLNQLIERCIDVVELRFAIFHGLSNNRFKRLDISDAKELVGYAPQDDAFELNVKLKHLKLSEVVQSHSVADGRQKSGLREDL